MENYKTEKEFCESIHVVPGQLIKTSHELIPHWYTPEQFASKFKQCLIDTGEIRLANETFECSLCEREKSIFNRTEGRPNVCEKCNREEMVPADRWISIYTPPKESGRYWCYVKEVNDLGISTFQWNCAYDKENNTWSDNLQNMSVTYWQPLPPAPGEHNTKS